MKLYNSLKENYLLIIHALGFVLMVTGLLFSRLTLTIGLIVLCAAIFIHPNFKDGLKRLFGNKALLLITAIFFLYLISGLLFSEPESGLEKIRVKLPFLFLPLAFAFIGRIEFPTYKWIHALLYSLICVSSFSVMVTYGFNYQEINDLYLKGHIMPTPLNHIRYSLIIVYAIIFGIVFYKRLELRKIWVRGIFIFSILWLIAFVHFLGVRSGILALYLCFIYLIIKYVVKYKKLIHGLFFLIALPLIFIIAYHTSTPLKNKIEYTKYSFVKLFRDGKISNMSDSERITSILVGIDIGKRHPVTGVGVGDVKAAMRKTYRKKFPGETISIAPHNQYIYVFAATGVLGLTVFLLVTTYPLFYRFAFKSTLFTSLHIIIYSSFLSEATLERQVGVFFYLFFLLFNMACLPPNKYEKY